MKKFNKNPRLWIVALTLLVSSTVSAQEVPYTPFNFEGNPVWNEALVVGGSGFILGGNSKFWIEGDTVINSLHYSKLLGFVGLEEDTVTEETTKTIGFLREESKKIYFVFPDLATLQNTHYLYGIGVFPLEDIVEGEEHVVYDFNLSVGDTIQNFISASMLGGWWGYPLIVDSISAINSDNQIRNAWYISSVYGATPGVFFVWVEGVGSNWGVIRPLPFPAGGSLEYLYYDVATSVLTCYSDNNFNYKNKYLSMWSEYYLIETETYNLDGSCIVNVVISTNEIDLNNNFKVYPNPSEGIFEIFLPESSILPVEIGLYNLYGNHILNLELTDIQTSYNLNNLKPGMYFFAGKGLKPKKIVIQ